MFQVITKTGDESVDELAGWVESGRHTLRDCLRMANNRALTAVTNCRRADYSDVAHLTLALVDYRPTNTPTS